MHVLLPGAVLGELVVLHPARGQALPAEIVGVDGEAAVLAPIGEVKGLSAGCAAIRMGRALDVPVGPSLLGRVLDGLGRPMDSDTRGPLEENERRPCEVPPVSALSRAVIADPFPVGIRAIDGLVTCGEGQRIGIYGEPGAGKSVLVGQLVRNSGADVVVVGLIGERGREVGEFLARQLPPAIRQRSILVVATSDRPALERMRAAHTATTIAESFRDQGLRVLLVIDSITRFARAMREIGLAAGEPPARRGFPPSVMAQLPLLLERPGLGKAAGSITAFYTVLIEGDGTDDPIAEETRSLLDGHIVLSPKLAAAGQFPAIDVVASRSRVMDSVTSARHRVAADHLRRLIHRHQEAEFLVQVGEYRQGSDPLTDEAFAKLEDIRTFLQQSPTEANTLDESVAWLERLKR